MEVKAGTCRSRNHCWWVPSSIILVPSKLSFPLSSINKNVSITESKVVNLWTVTAAAHLHVPPFWLLPLSVSDSQDFQYWPNSVVLLLSFIPLTLSYFFSNSCTGSSRPTKEKAPPNILPHLFPSPGITH
ncbi:hypothetical protein H6P81_003630 [Aristolochia fimbriata]|uniref:Uncharacterized protein n=1 Tax=Aristolochia fimbriata TaxID=158543 RepID=A0AAV7FH30_ARIFI|nr:hypothetical protein H6P81_003630 [Aristolochia fimbriata]